MISTSHSKITATGSSAPSASPTLDWLEDVRVFAVNRLAAHSDHGYYKTAEEARNRTPMRMRHSLNGAWKFHYAANPALRPASFYEEDFGCGGWGDIQVPGHIQLQGYGQPQYVNTMYPWDGQEELRPPFISKEHNPVGSYVKFFDLPKEMRGEPVYISFQGVETAFYVWLNGQFVGYSEDSFTPSEFDLTPYVREGENKLAVEVFQRSTGSWLEDQDFWRFSGIFRDVYLYTVPSIHVYDLDVRAELDDSFAAGTLRAGLTFRELPPRGAKAVATLYDACGGQVAEVSAALGEGMKATLEAEVAGPELWSAESPYLYELILEIYDAEGTLVEAIPSRIGFRRFEMTGKIMTINGKRIVFKGVNRHEFNCRTGRAITKEDMLWDIQTLKRNNMNAVRTSHYPNQSYWYELCDEYGVYVIDEMNLETHGSWQKMGAVEPSWNIPGSKPEWQDIVLDRAVSMYERDKNHPSILIWSLGNESYVGDVLVNAARYFRSVDGGRLVHYEGVFYDRAFTEASDMESRMYAKPADIAKYLEENPDKPYISCEYMHAMGNSLGGMSKYTDLEREYPMYQGGFIWDYIDQSIVKKDRYGEEFLAYGGDFGDRPTDYGFCTNGIVYADRKLSPKMQEVKFLYQNIKLTPDREGVAIRNENLFADTSQLDLLFALSAEGRELERRVVQANVAPCGEAYVPIELAKLGDGLAPGEYAIDASFRLKEAAIWAEAGHEVAFGQHVFRVEDETVSGNNGEASGLLLVAGGSIDGGFGNLCGADGCAVFGTETDARGKLKVVHGDVNIGVKGRDFSALFSKQAMSLISLNYSGREMIASPPSPLFWRATTDNDRGFSQGFDAGAWYAASLSRKCVGIDVSENGEDGAVTIAYRFRFSVSAELETRVAYTVRPDGSIRVQADYSGAANLPKLPIFAVSFKVSADYDRLKWLALGPEENYADRAQGARLCEFEGTAAGNVSGYVMPQESGNRTGVRRVDVTDVLGRGIRIVADGAPVECGISPYTAFELENAQHHYELPQQHYTVITVAGRQMGVGGDDSWGAPVHEEYTIPSDKPMTFSFVIERV
ncbi:glycoside hydrolase family 2 TIM barrel-domain containing protein [Paenibacillus sp. LHD-117]|uniref:glycoside hydrolase family 2 TIM barrel-domain containing protein n=1 Tax=Paenibacillus sp. LHD-117 TaxID=3071412 RepID=UPI0027E069C0|nr:glycoside hydrolase family 2 TIM barrel-domain containing protein [Paenibacillus sp. LHD-117]MDQ6420235.1 glycoside hydrolase family 2 TIM barrel-domain containing protein [Paenibacillus sp. LHD-117]